MQESSSEALNAYYGVYLLGVARGDGALADWGRLLLAVELRGAKKYWHIKPTGPQIYPKPFASTGVVGVLWSTQVGARSLNFSVPLGWVHRHWRFLPDHQLPSYAT